jgi:hypothetical protein
MQNDGVLSAAPLTIGRRLNCGNRERLQITLGLAIRRASRPTSAQRFTQAENRLPDALNDRVWDLTAVPNRHAE